MSNSPIAVRYREFTANLVAGNTDGAAELIADDVEWFGIGSSTPIRGRDAVVEQFGFVSQYAMDIEVHDVVANDDHLIALLNVTVTKDGEVFTYRTAEVHHVNGDGQITQRWAFSDDTQAIVNFFS
jgi:ketosteroid isomerase-like protein